ncbi:MAG: cysteine synthase family protein [Bifidobacteriaceae bacterium]|jgi:cysteine synthase|nr:cysteine synthase family protein [Bifidobacteriaceae bacterium]
MAIPSELEAAFPDPDAAPTFESPFALVGNTPLVRLTKVLEPGTQAKVYVKLDQYNLGGSSKDRIGIGIIRDAIASGELPDGHRIIDFGAGNTAIGYALAGLATGHPVTIVANASLSPEKANLLRFLGAEIIPGRIDVPRDHPENWACVAERHADEDPSTWWARQESTPANPSAHFNSTGPEIWRQTDGQVTHFLAAIATGGTVSGTGRYLHERNPQVQVIATDFADGPNAKTNLFAVADKLDGWEELEHDWARNIDLDVIDRLSTRPRRDAIDFGWRLARTEGLLLGPSSTLSAAIAVELAAKAAPDAVFVVFSADSGRDYLSREYNADWLRANGHAEIADAYAGAQT